METAAKQHDELLTEYTRLGREIETLLARPGLRGFLSRRIKLKKLYDEKSKCHYQMKDIYDQVIAELDTSKKKELGLIEELEDEKDYGECECTLDYMPSAGWGVGYVCIPCAKQLRGEYE